MTDTKGLHQVTGTGINFENSPNVTKLDLGAAPTLCAQSDGSIFSGVAGETSQWSFRCKNTLATVSVGDNQTLLGPVLNASGLNIAGDQTDDDGWQFFGKSSLALGKLNKDYFTIGTSPAFYMKVKFSISDVSDIDDLRCGFVKDEAFAAAPDDYNDLATLACMAGDIKTQTIVGNATTVATDLTSGGGDGAGNWADTATHTFEVRVSAAGAVTYLLDNVSPTGAVAYAFTSGLNVTPFWYHIHDGDGTCAIVWQEFEFGLQAHRTPVS